MNKKQDFKPYFLTANHCIPTSYEAESMEIQWNYRTESCSSSALDSTSYYQGGGAELLYNNEKTDTAFMRLIFQPRSGTAGTYFSWWDASPQNLNLAVESFHYPRGDREKYSSGVISNFTAMYTPLDCPECVMMHTSSVSSADYPFYEVTWTKGIVEGGSSGGPLFSHGGRFIGQLWGRRWGIVVSTPLSTQKPTARPTQKL
jgi:hypothetical protein